MADNTTLNEGSGGDVVATDDIGGVKYQRVKPAIGTDGSATDVSDANPMPIGGNTVKDGSGTAYSLLLDSDGHLQIDAVTSQGDVAHADADAGNPVKIGARASSAEPSAVANADRVNLIADLVGKLITLPYANPENFVSGTANAADTSDTAVLAAAGAGVRNYVTSIVVHNSSATDAYVTVKDGSTGKLVVPAPANSGATHTLPVPLRGTANTAVNFAASTAVTTMYVSMVGYKGA